MTGLLILAMLVVLSWCKTQVPVYVNLTDLAWRNSDNQTEDQGIFQIFCFKSSHHNIFVKWVSYITVNNSHSSLLCYSKYSYFLQSVSLSFYLCIFFFLAWLLFANSTPAKYKNARLWEPLRGTFLWCCEEITEWVREWGIEKQNEREWVCVYFLIYYLFFCPKYCK